ncbi:MAG: hypothetical protein K0B15_12320 [Lentimicrobium sp.]|nr:hypothetical protein [Lentimicrobium sp.]
MGIYDFNILSNDDKADILWDRGVFMMNRSEDGFDINLYSLDDFFVEAWYNPEANVIEKFRTFKSLNPLEPYLDRIKLNLK